jgi:chromosome segregation ATPase
MGPLEEFLRTVIQQESNATTWDPWLVLVALAEPPESWRQEVETLTSQEREELYARLAGAKNPLADATLLALADFVTMHDRAAGRERWHANIAEAARRSEARLARVREALQDELDEDRKQALNVASEVTALATLREGLRSDQEHDPLHRRRMRLQEEIRQLELDRAALATYDPVGRTADRDQLASTVAAADAEKKGIETQIRDAQDARSVLEEELAPLRQAFAAAKTEHQQSLDECEQLRHSIARLDGERRALLAEAEHSRAVAGEVNSRVQELQYLVGLAHQMTQNAQAEFAPLIAAGDVFQNELADVCQRLGSTVRRAYEVSAEVAAFDDPRPTDRSL